MVRRHTNPSTGEHTSPGMSWYAYARSWWLSGKDSWISHRCPLAKFRQAACACQYDFMNHTQAGLDDFALSPRCSANPDTPPPKRGYLRGFMQ